MASETPGQGGGPDQPEPPDPASAPEPAWTTPPPPAAPAVDPAAGSWNAGPQQPAQPGWGQQPAQPQPGAQWGAPQQPANPAPQQAAQPGWGQQPAQPQPGGQWGAPQQPATPAPQQPAEPGWGQQPSAPPPQQPAQPGWGQQPSAPPPQQPAQPGWGQQPTGPQPQQPGQWGAPVAGAGYGAPPPQQPGPQPGWGAPGQPQQGWVGGPPPAKSGGNGCLKACLIVGVILVILAGLAFAALMIAGGSIVGGLGVDSSGNLKDCSIVSSQQLQSVLGPDTEAHPLTGLANTTIGATLDKRVIGDADNCYIISGASASSSQNAGGYGRIAKYSGGDAQSKFSAEVASAKSGGYFAVDVPGAGDQAMCTGWSDKYPATGALVRKGNDLVYVSLLIGSDFVGLDLASSDTGVPYSQSACDQAVSIAQLAFH